MKSLQRFEKIIGAVGKRIQEEVGTLIGTEFFLDLEEGIVVSKAEFFDQLLGKQILAKMDITGEVECKGGLFVSVRDGVRLGGTLIMLPASELEEVVAHENYDGETADSYGEIANIIAGAYTKTFEEMSKVAWRFIRKEQELVVPVKVDVASDEPVPDQLYYRVLMKMKLDGKQLGDMIMLVPAVPFGLVSESTAERSQPSEADEPPVQAAREPASTSEPSPPPAAQQHDEADAEPEKTDQVSPPIDIVKHKKRIDKIFKTCKKKIEEEVGVLLGVKVSCGNQENRFIGKETYFHEEASSTQVLAHMDVAGDMAGNSYLAIDLKDAIRIGGALIMLPPQELEEAVVEEEFSSDCQDAYGEIANIIAGVYSAVFEEQYTQALRFVKTSIEQVVPLKVEIDDEQPIPDILYYMSSMHLSLAGKEYGRLSMLFPATMLQLESYNTQAEEANKEAKKGSAEISPERPGSDDAALATPTSADGEKDVLIISDSESDALLIKEVLGARDISWKQLSFRDSVKQYLPGAYKAVFLVMHKVDEQSFGVAIKVSSCCSLPLIAVGREWTRTTVIRAVKYGVTDILPAPFAKEDIEATIKSNIMELAA